MRPPSRGSKLVALALVAIVVVAGFGYWVFTPKMPSQIISVTEQTSLTTSTEQTAASSTASTTVSATTQWINVGESHPVSYYVSMLKSSGTQPYVELGWELQALPDATNATAVAKITYLALNATNPEVKEAFELMMKGGTLSRKVADISSSLNLSSSSEAKPKRAIVLTSERAFLSLAWEVEVPCQTPSFDQKGWSQA